MRRRVAPALALVIGIAMLAAGCGDDGDDDGRSQETRPETTEPDPAANEPPGDPASGRGNLELLVDNQSGADLAFVVYATVRGASSNVLPTAWQVQSSGGGELRFEFTTSPSFMWSPVTAIPGAVFNAQEIIPADPNTAGPASSTTPGNWVTFTDAPGFPGFADQPPVQDPQTGALTVLTSAASGSAVGIGLNGSVALAASAVSGQTVTLPWNGLTLHVAAATEPLQPGQVLEAGGPPNSVELDFPQSGVLRATLANDNTWSVEPG